MLFPDVHGAVKPEEDFPRWFLKRKLAVVARVQFCGDESFGSEPDAELDVSQEISVSAQELCREKHEHDVVVRQRGRALSFFGHVCVELFTHGFEDGFIRDVKKSIYREESRHTKGEMATYFVGNILQPVNERTSADETFRFTEDESNTLDCVGLPVRMEHAESLTCGKIIRQMRDKSSGKVYVVGKIEDGSMLSEDPNFVRVFADKSICKKGQKGYYGSLSLQHMHEEDELGNKTKRGIEVSLVHEPRRKNCDIVAVCRSKKKRSTSLAKRPGPRSSAHFASAKKQAPEIPEYICNPGTITNTPDRIVKMSTPTAPSTTMETAKKEISPEPASEPVAEKKSESTTGKVGQASAESGKGDIVMDDVIQTVLLQAKEKEEQEKEIEELKKQLDEQKKLLETEMEEKNERKRKEEEALQKKRKADAEKALGFMESCAEMWDEQISDQAIWSDNKDEQMSKMKQLVEENPSLAKDLFQVVHCASSRYADMVNDNVEKQTTLTQRLGHVMKKRKTVHAASARATSSAPSAPAATKPKSRTEDLMSIMSNYAGRTSGSATNLMQKLYNSRIERQNSSRPF